MCTACRKSEMKETYYDGKPLVFVVQVVAAKRCFYMSANDEHQLHTAAVSPTVENDAQLTQWARRLYAIVEQRE